MNNEVRANIDKIFLFLDKNENDFLMEWEQFIKLSNSDIHKDKVKNNGYQMYILVKKTLKDLISDEELKQLAAKVAIERVEANINIGEFVYNVNFGRTVILKYISKVDIPIQDLQKAIEKINYLFDQFSYYAVKKYTEIKDKELEEKTIIIHETQKDRLALLGQMSSSFVHEFRNPLTAVIGFTKLLRDEYPTLKYLDIIDVELEQLNFRITQFLHTSKANIPSKKAEKINVNEIISNILQLMYPSIVASDVDVKVDMESEVILEGNKDELRQVLLNLIINSIDALNNREKPKVIKISNSESGRFVGISISNNGPEIPENTIGTIFEPFYSTKELGTGIGLFVCKNIIEKHNGTIYCKSTREETTFHVELPRMGKV
ncbi:histidine kinase N-terminal domain-containing protein [Sutcliffiella cohnii]